MRTDKRTMDLLIWIMHSCGLGRGDKGRMVALYDKLHRERSGPPLVYIAGPYSAPTRDEVERNIGRAEGVGLMVAQAGAMPVIPHSNTGAPGFDRAQPYEFWIAGTMALMYRCDAVVMAPRWTDSKGAMGEWQEAKRIGMPVFDDVGPDFRVWLAKWKAGE